MLMDVETALPFWRALMRVEADLLVQSADRLSAANFGEVLTSHQPSPEALMELARRLGRATPAPGHPPGHGDDTPPEDALVPGPGGT